MPGAESKSWTHASCPRLTAVNNAVSPLPFIAFTSIPGASRSRSTIAFDAKSHLHCVREPKKKKTPPKKRNTKNKEIKCYEAYRIMKLKKEDRRYRFQWHTHIEKAQITHVSSERTSKPWFAAAHIGVTPSLSFRFTSTYMTSSWLRTWAYLKLPSLLMATPWTTTSCVGSGAPHQFFRVNEMPEG